MNAPWRRQDRPVRHRAGGGRGPGSSARQGGSTGLRAASAHRL
ncbi:hypothetical protein SGL43_01523 [Streptomyces globisporus]|uniref:Uncharacterized protein n=1 Tax=Streptomyces globisporus TaxID=1908 RepID=A0ABM9GTK1_STRGL|nr:hypothetical protein SGL43_01523 [Streptomyces globisporus]